MRLLLCRRQQLVHSAAPSWRTYSYRLSARFCSCHAGPARLSTQPTQSRQSTAPSSISASSSLWRRNASGSSSHSQSSSVAVDHRTLGTEQELFTSSPYSPGSPLFLPNGTHVVNKLVDFLRAQYRQYGFQEVLTPNIYKKSLWEISGHWQNYKEDMYEVRGRGATGENGGEIGEDESYGLKPMNCPGHCLLFKSQKHSYRQLPVRYADFSPLHRNEISGSLSGLTRVRRFHQDDGHIFCRPQQIKQEISLALGFVDMVMQTFRLGSYRLMLSTRPEKDFIGSLELWDSAESQLRDALESSGRAWELNEGDGAFYGPKIDIQLQDANGKYFQLSTIQLDLNLPQRFGLEYQVGEGEEEFDLQNPGKATPVMIHRAVFGSLERFLAILIERYAGRWPFWLSPRQCIILTVHQNQEVLDLASQAAAQLSGFRALLPTYRSEQDPKPPTPLASTDPTFLVDVDNSSDSLGKKVARAKKLKYNLIFVVGQKNLPDQSIEVDIDGQLKSSDDEGAAKLRGLLAGVGAGSSAQSGRSMKMRIEDVHPLLAQLEKHFL